MSAGWLLPCSDIEFKGLLLCALRASHRKHIADLIGETHGNRKAVVKIAGVVIDFGQSHDVVQNILERRHFVAGSKYGYKERVGGFRPDVGVELRQITGGPKIRIL